jgi:predicted enzyme related to lactoylglutathione lyase
MQNRAVEIPGVKVLSQGIEEMKEAPGGGYIVTLSDPEGFPISLAWSDPRRSAATAGENHYQ